MLQERRITPGEALNHAFVTLAHLVDYAHCNNVKASVQMMEVCRRNGYVNNSSGSSHHHHSSAGPPQAVVANFVPSSNGNVTLAFNNQLTNQVPRIMRERTVAAPPPAPPPHSFDNLVSSMFCMLIGSKLDEFVIRICFFDLFYSISCTIAVQ